MTSQYISCRHGLCHWLSVGGLSTTLSLSFLCSQRTQLSSIVQHSLLIKFNIKSSKMSASVILLIILLQVYWQTITLWNVNDSHCSSTSDKQKMLSQHYVPSFTRSSSTDTLSKPLPTVSTECKVTGGHRPIPFRATEQISMWSDNVTYQVIVCAELVVS